MKTTRDLADSQAHAPAERLKLYAGQAGAVGAIDDRFRREADRRVGYMSGAAAFLELLPQTLVDRILAGRF